MENKGRNTVMWACSAMLVKTEGSHVSWCLSFWMVVFSEKKGGRIALEDGACRYP
jgi:hypothetical protein